MNEISKFRIFGKYIKYVYYDLKNIKVIHCIGDSHANIFNYYRENKIFNRTVFKVCAVTGATALGINNLNSKSTARMQINKYLRYVKKKHNILISLGEVDCDFTLWLRSKKTGNNIDKQLQLALHRYKFFIDKLYDRGFQNLIIYSAPLPTIRKKDKGGWVSKSRKEADIGIKRRTKLTRIFNSSMADYCIKKGIIFLDLESVIMNKNTGLISQKYINPNRLDHHLYKKTTIPKITKLLNNIGFH